MKDILYYAQLALESVASVFGLRPYEEPKYAVIGAALEHAAHLVHELHAAQPMTR